MGKVDGAIFLSSSPKIRSKLLSARKDLRAHKDRPVTQGLKVLKECRVLLEQPEHRVPPELRARKDQRETPELLVYKDQRAIPVIRALKAPPDRLERPDKLNNGGLQRTIR
jgi:hypothetical protein